MSKSKLFFLITIALPLVLLILAEVILRLAGYGDTYPLFVDYPAHEQYLQINPDLGRRYFPTQAVRPQTSPDILLKEKPDNGYRIFVFGGSAAAGYPYYYNMTFSRMLKDRLDDAFPDRHIEVINLAMPAINSHAILDLTKRVLAYEPDAFLIYAGHNEFFGSFGVASREGLVSSRFFVKAYLRLQDYRLFQLLRNSIQKLSAMLAAPNDSDTVNNQTLMENMVAEQRIPYGSELYKKGLSQFRANFEELIRLASQHHIAVVFGELISNLSDQPPFLSVAGDEAFEPDSTLLSITPLTDLTEIPWPSEKLQSWLDQDSAYAMTHFLLGKREEQMGQFEMANHHYLKARDWDALRFRASGDINRIIREFGQSHGLVVVPLYADFRTVSAHGLIGNQWMLDHLHLNYQAAFMMARFFFEALHNRLISPDWSLEHLGDDQLYRQRMAMTPLDEAIARLRIQILEAGWPFQKESRVESFLKTYQPADMYEQIAYDFWLNTISWYNAHLFLARHFARERLWKAAQQEYKALIKVYPFDWSVLNELGRVYLAEGQNQEALRVLTRSRETQENAPACRLLGAIHLQEKQYEQAIFFLRKALQFDAEDQQSLFNLAGALALSGAYDQALTYLQKFLKLDPGNREALQLLRQIERQTPK